MQYYTETIDIQKLRTIIENFDQLKDVIGFAYDRKTYERVDSEATKSILSKYLASKDYNGSSVIFYDFSSRSKGGRLFSQTASLQGLPRTIRHTISRDTMIDIDIKNCHPEILKWYGSKNGLNLSNLSYYTENRNECLLELSTIYSISKDEAKRHVLSIINGGNPHKLDMNKSPDWFRNLCCEILDAHDFILVKESHFKEEAIKSKGEDYYNLKGSVCNKMFCYWENVILNHMIDYSKSLNVTIGALCFDGLMVYEEGLPELTSYLSSMQQYVFNKVDIDLEIVKKEMDEVIDLSNLPPAPLHATVDDYIWTNFLLDSRELFTSYNDLMDHFRTNFPRVCKRINLGSGFYLKKEHKDLLYNNVTLRELDKSVLFRYMTTNTTAQGKTSEKMVTLTLGALFEQSRLPLYSHVVCHPKSKEPLAFNTWLPFKADIVRVPDRDRLEILLDFLETIICDRNKDMYRYLLTWLHQVCIYPEEKTGKVLVLQSKPGAGKGTFVDWITKHLFGRYSAVNMRLEEVTDKFNSGLMNKVFVSIDELPTTSEKFYHVFDTLKNLITADVMNIQFKGKESFTTNNLLNFVMMTNHKYSIRVEEGDRRYVVFAVNEEKIGDNDYWSYLHETVFNEEGALDFFNYLRTLRREDRWQNLNMIPVTELRTHMIDNSMNSMQLFLKEVRERTLEDKIQLLSGDEIAINVIPAEEKVAVKKNDLFTVYTNYCATVGEKVHKAKMFNQYLDEKRNAEARYYLV